MHEHQRCSLFYFVIFTLEKWIVRRMYLNRIFATSEHWWYWEIEKNIQKFTHIYHDIKQKGNEIFDFIRLYVKIKIKKYKRKSWEKNSFFILMLEQKKDNWIISDFCTNFMCALYIKLLVGWVGHVSFHLFFFCLESGVSTHCESKIQNLSSTLHVLTLKHPRCY